MAMDFPIAPTVGDLFQPPSSPYTYQWDGVGWILYGSALEREPGGMYLFESVDLTGLANYDFEMLAGYDYDIELKGPLPSVDDNFVVGAFSQDGGLNFSTTDCFWTYMIGQSSANVAVSGGSNTTILLLGATASSATGEYSNGTTTIRGQDDSSVLTVLDVCYLASSATTTQSSRGRAGHNIFVVSNAFRIAWNGYLSTTFTKGKLDIYRRNRALTFP